MVKIRKPKIPADLHLKYTGRRMTYLYSESNPSFMSIGIEMDANLGEEKDVIAFKVKLFDDSERYISLLSRQVYLVENGSIRRDESAFITHYEFIVANNLVFIKGQLFYNLDEIEEVYEYKLFMRSASYIYSKLEKYEIEFEDYTK